MFYFIAQAYLSLDLILLWPVTYFRDIKPKNYGIGSQTEFSRQLTDHGTNRSRLPHLHRVYDSYSLYPEKISKEGGDLRSRFPSNLADPSPINPPAA
jgi:hypothetical protein